MGYTARTFVIGKENKIIFVFFSPKTAKQNATDCTAFG